MYDQANGYPITTESGTCEEPLSQHTCVWLGTWWLSAGWTATETVSHSNKPSGCYQDVANKKTYFNTHANANACSSDPRCLCGAKSPSTPPSPPPSPPPPSPPAGGRRLAAMRDDDGVWETDGLTFPIDTVRRSSAAGPMLRHQLVCVAPSAR